MLTVKAVTRLAVLLVVCACLPGCMTAAYLTGEVSSAFQEKFEQSGIIAATIAIDGAEYKLRMPARCRSFIHPMTGTRVGERGAYAYEFSTGSNTLLLLEVPYSCDEQDAHIELSMGRLIKIYKIDKSVTDAVTLTWAVPANVPLKSQRPAVLFSIGLKQDGASNVTPVSHVRDAVLGHLGAGEGDKFISARLERIPIKEGHLPPPGADMVLADSYPSALSAEATAFIRRKLRNEGLFGPHSIGAASGLSSEAPLLRSALSNTLKEGPRGAGFRVYYKYSQPSYLSSYGIQIGDLVVPARDSPAVYVPEEKTAYVVWADSL